MKPSQTVFLLAVGSASVHAYEWGLPSWISNAGKTLRSKFVSSYSIENEPVLREAGRRADSLPGAVLDATPVAVVDEKEGNAPELEVKGLENRVDPEQSLSDTVKEIDSLEGQNGSHNREDGLEKDLLDRASHHGPDDKEVPAESSTAVLLLRVSAPSRAPIEGALDGTANGFDGATKQATQTLQPKKVTVAASEGEGGDAVKEVAATASPLAEDASKQESSSSMQGQAAKSKNSLDAAGPLTTGSALADNKPALTDNAPISTDRDAAMANASTAKEAPVEGSPGVAVPSSGPVPDGSRADSQANPTMGTGTASPDNSTGATNAVGDGKHKETLQGPEGNPKSLTVALSVDASEEAPKGPLDDATRQKGHQGILPQSPATVLTISVTPILQ